jgi:hypothetical protein
MKTPKSPEQLKQEFKNCIERELIPAYEDYYNLIRENKEISEIMVKLENTPLYEATFYAYIVKLFTSKIDKCKIKELLQNEN